MVKTPATIGKNANTGAAPSLAPASQIFNLHFLHVSKNKISDSSFDRYETILGAFLVEKMSLRGNFTLFADRTHLHYMKIYKKKSHTPKIR